MLSSSVVCLSFILMSSAIYYWTDSPQHVIYCLVLYNEQYLPATAWLLEDFNSTAFLGII